MDRTSKMIQPTSLTTDRLIVEPLTQRHSNFIFELVNTEGWITYIGDRHVNSPADATAYIQKILSNPNIVYWVVSRKEDATPIGIVTFIKRDYLQHPDIGFAFLPNVSNNGYAFEATSAVLNSLRVSNAFENILATTIPENKNSIKLLNKLGLYFEREIDVNQEILHIYGASADALSINTLVKTFFGIFTSKNNRQQDWNLIHSICIPEALIIKVTDTERASYNLTSFIEPRRKILTDGTLTEFEEFEISEQTKIIGSIAHRYSHYQKNAVAEGKSFSQRGHKFFQFMKTKEGWRITSVIWQDE